ncbi:OTU-like cysteine protease, putative [Trichoderma parareesei]|uniref:OTU-like cysteine protease, putative n=1 Tax=Trichoderma parareesei TaxID=858221 RepID=A0A2H2ZGU3_TRIPA|nr:OTU-like cysteine protease, putative [Trichoderma parareesei]
MQARHRRELKDLQGRITNKKKNATKKTRKGVNDECAEMERQLREKQAAEVAALSGEAEEKGEEEDGEPEEGVQQQEDTQQQKDGLTNGTVTTQGLEEATSKLNLDTNEGTKGQQQQQPPGKKRNRQKERMARRAAEHEAAMLSAEQEASTMTDHRAKESAYMKKEFSAHGLSEKEIQPDGHCLFSALADQLSHNGIPLSAEEGGEAAAAAAEREPAYRTVRRAATGYMEAHADDFAPFLEEDLGDYVRRMRDTAEWGGQLELMAVARRYGVEIRVIQDGRTERIGGDEEGKGEGDGAKTLWLAYYRHGYGLGEHYNSLRRATATAATAE